MKLSLAIGTLAAAIAVLLAPMAQADPPRHMHDYLAATQTVSAVPPDVRDHAQIKQIIALSGNAGPSPRSSFNWTDAGIGAGTTAGGMLILAAATAFTLRRRVRLAL